MAPLVCSSSLVLPLLIAILSLCEAQIFTALTHMTDLINLERSFSFLLDEYLQQSTYVSPPSEMTRFSNDVKHHLSYIKDENMEVFLGHPVNSYLLVRRFLRDWRDFVRELDETHPIGEGSVFS